MNLMCFYILSVEDYEFKCLKYTIYLSILYNSIKKFLKNVSPIIIIGYYNEFHVVIKSLQNKNVFGVVRNITILEKLSIRVRLRHEILLSNMSRK